MNKHQPGIEDLLYPALSPYRQAFLSVGDGHRLYFDESGTQDGFPVVCLHGGPGSGAGPLLRRFFDPARYRIILYDQRGAGRSEPAGSLENNTTPAMVDDLEALRRHLGIGSWLLFGGSWGATLALRYTLTYPASVRALILRGPLLGRKKDIDWFFGPNGAARIFPQQYEAFLRPVHEQLRTTPLLGYQSLFQSSEEQRHLAAKAWATWDQCVATGQTVDAEADGNPNRSAIACHYALHNFFLPEAGVLAEAETLGDIPGWLIQGQLDLVCPAEGAYSLAKLWPGAALRIIRSGGHLMTDHHIAHALLRAVQEYTESQHADGMHTRRFQV